MTARVYGPEPIRIPEIIVEGKRLGRHIRHDPRSRRYRVQRRSGAPITSQRWLRHTPILNQGGLASCTGNAAVGALGTEPLFASLASRLASGLMLDEAEAVTIYSAATHIDPWSGEYPPTDTGSDGLSVAKAAQQFGLISGYVHALSLDDVLVGLQSGPMIVGTDWRDGMDHPDASGCVEATGARRGGHEYECLGNDHENRLLWFANSWGPGWGQAGLFCYSYDTMTELLDAHGDATQFVPVTSPPPTPVDVDVKVTFTAAGAAALDGWARRWHITTSGQRAAAAWKAGKR